MIDLIWLLSEKPTINWPIVFQSISEECKRDKPKRSHIGYLHYLRNHRLAEHPYFSAFNNILNPLWNSWRNHDNDYFQQASKLYGQAAINKLRWGQGGIKRSFTENAPIPIHLTELLEQLHHALDIPEFTQFLSTLSEKSGIIHRILNTFRT